ncbi:MAG: VanZ family protein [Nevskiales bacterium]
MRPLRYFKTWWALGAVYFVFIVCASLINLPPELALPSDKLLHFVAYLVLSAWFGAVYQKSRHIGVLMASVLTGITLEVLQLLTGHRSLEVLDMLANTLGATAGITLARTRLGESLVHLEQQLFAAA